MFTLCTRNRGLSEEHRHVPLWTLVNTVSLQVEHLGYAGATEIHIQQSNLVQWDLLHAYGINTHIHTAWIHTHKHTLQEYAHPHNTPTYAHILCMNVYTHSEWMCTHTHACIRSYTCTCTLTSTALVTHAHTCFFFIIFCSHWFSTMLNITV